MSIKYRYKFNFFYFLFYFDIIEQNFQFNNVLAVNAYQALITCCDIIEQFNNYNNPLRYKTVIATLTVKIQLSYHDRGGMLASILCLIYTEIE